VLLPLQLRHLQTLRHGRFLGVYVRYNSGMTVKHGSEQDLIRTPAQQWFNVALRSGKQWPLVTRLAPLMRPFQHLLYICVRIVPRDRNLWVFGSWGGKRYADNAAALFRYSNSADASKVRCIWITNSDDIRKKLLSQGYEAHKALSVAGLFYSLRAGVYVFDGLTKDINHWTSNGAKRVLLRHGVGIKKIERAIDQKDHRLFKLFHGSWWQQLAWSFLLPWHRVRPDLVLASSEGHAQQAERFFDVPTHKTSVTGMPRTDSLFDGDHQAQIPEQIKTWIDASRKDGRAIVLYLPTFRDDGSESVPFDWPSLDGMLEGTRANILFKAHPADKSMTIASNEKFEHVLNVPAHVDPGVLLSLADCFVTDYSSVVYDFMLLRRPVIFFCPDLEEYQRFSRTLDIPYEEATPGRHARSLAELVDAIKYATHEDAHQRIVNAEYESVLSLFHAFNDGNSSQRVYDEIYKRFVLPANTLKGD